MNRSSILVAALLCATGSASMAQDTATSAQSSASAKEFVEKAGTSGLAEVEMGELGVRRRRTARSRRLPSGWSQTTRRRTRSS